MSSILFFEGFNYEPFDFLKLNPLYWSTNNLSKISFTFGRTDSCVALTNRSSVQNLDQNTLLSLSNFPDPLVENTGFCLGFGVQSALTHRSTTQSSFPYLENFVKFYDGDTEVLSIDIVQTTGVYGTSLGFALYQDNTLVDIYDLKSYEGYSWTITETLPISLYDPSYIEIFIDPTENNHLSINFSAGNTKNAQLKNTNDEFYTTITGFSNLSKITFSSQSTLIDSSFRIDDLYIKDIVRNSIPLSTTPKLCI
jgi:hypothetical protein